jgi:hypothetical protein
MSDLEDLGFTSISDMSTDEALELLRTIRLSRRVSVKEIKQSTKKPVAPKVSDDQASELLKLLLGDK